MQQNLIIHTYTYIKLATLRPFNLQQSNLIEVHKLHPIVFDIKWLSTHLQ